MVGRSVGKREVTTFGRPESIVAVISPLLVLMAHAGVIFVVALPETVCSLDFLAKGRQGIAVRVYEVLLVLDEERIMAVFVAQVLALVVAPVSGVSELDDSRSVLLSKQEVQL